MSNSQGKLTKEDTFKILDNINMWIGNCDSKASIILAVIGIVTSVTFSSEIIRPLYSIVIDSFSKSGWCILVSILLWISIISMIAGVAFLIMTIIPSLKYSYKVKSKEKPRFDSVMFFGTVGDLEFSSYKERVKEITEEQIMDDLFFQITSAAKICKTKFLRMNRGIKCFSIGLFLFIITVGTFVVLK